VRELYETLLWYNIVRELYETLLWYNIVRELYETLLWYNIVRCAHNIGAQLAHNAVYSSLYSSRTVL